MDFNNTLHKLGLTPIEANVFITLCKHGALTGYEVSKITGISRSNVYSALYSLQEKGKCELAPTESSKYIAISKDELLLSAKRYMEQILDEISTLYPEPIQETNESYSTVSGYDNVIDKIRNHILLCKSHLYILCSTKLALLFKDELIEVSKTRRITIICEDNLELSSNIKVLYRDSDPKVFHMIIDTSSLITGEIATNHSQCLYSNNKSLVSLMRDSFLYEINSAKETK